MAINFDSPEEIRKRLERKKAASARPTLRRPQPSAKFKAGATQPGRAGGAPRTPGSPRPTARPQPKAAAAKPTLRSRVGGVAKGIARKIPAFAAVGSTLSAAAEDPAGTVASVTPAGQALSVAPTIDFPKVSEVTGPESTFGGKLRAGASFMQNLARRGTESRLRAVPGLVGIGGEPSAAPAPTAPTQPRLRTRPAEEPLPQGTIIPGRTATEQQDVGRGVAGIESQTQAVRSQRAAQLGIPVEALPFIDAGGRVEDVEKALKANLQTDLGARDGALTGKEAADIKLRQQRLGFAISKEQGATAGRAEEAGRERAEFAQGQVDRLFQDVPEEQRGARAAQFEETYAGADFRTAQDFQQARQFQDVLEQARVAAEEASGIGFSKGGPLEFIDKWLGLNDPKVGPLSAKEAFTQIKSLVGENEAFGELLNESKTELSTKTMKLLAIMRKNAAKGRRLRDF